MGGGAARAGGAQRPDDDAQCLVFALVAREGRVLLVPSGGGPWVTGWTLPGGAAAGPRGLAGACGRVAGAQLGVPVEVDGLRLLVSATVAAAPGVVRDRALLAVFACRMPAVPPAPRSARWWRPEATPCGAAVPAPLVRRMIEDALAPGPYGRFRVATLGPASAANREVVAYA